eukprot:TRINITY_DN4051_c0_g5_i3.p1 TRINITY_DN4051_c0_g5~~TRINITY_DN4051_c0_g5_i3.p1  ORF type:complete len:1197 (-),score=247.61 TRINITY_DN4051_c0_g5_i3:657-4247(-)
MATTSLGTTSSGTTSHLLGATSSGTTSADSTLVVLITVDGVPVVGGTARAVATGRIVLEGSASPAFPKRQVQEFSFRWSIFADDVQLDANTVSPSPDSASLVIREGALASGRSYRFRLTAIGPDGSGSADFNLVTETAPGEGHLVVTPASTTFGLPTFTLTAESWTATQDELPLRYRFSYHTLDWPTNEVLLTPIAPENQITAVLPSAFGRSVGVVISVHVYALSGAFAMDSVPVTLPPLGDVDVVALVNDFLGPDGPVTVALGQQDTTTALGLLGTLGALVGSAPLITSEVRNSLQQRLLDVMSPLSDRLRYIDETEQQVSTLTLVSNGDTMPANQLSILDLVHRYLGASQEEPIMPQGLAGGLSSVIGNLYVSYGEWFGNFSGPDEAKSTALSIVDNVDTLFRAQIRHRVCGEAPVIVGDGSFQMLTATINPEFAPPALTMGAGSFSFGDSLRDTVGCSNVQVVAVSVDLGLAYFNSTRKVFLLGNLMTVNVEPQPSFAQGVFIEIARTDGGGPIDDSFCSFRQNITQRWQTDSTCTLVSQNATSAVCRCTHLTDFRVASSSQVAPPAVTEQNPQGLDSGTSSGLIAGVVAGVAFLVIIGLVLLFVIVRRRRQQRHKAYLVSRTALMENGSSFQFMTEDEIEVQEQLGSGNFGTVYKGLYLGTTPVALKKLKDESLADEFATEAITWKTLIHPNIVQFLGIYRAKSGLYMVTEFMPLGSVLDLLCQKQMELKPVHLVDMLRDVAAGMSFLEQHNIVHRDLAARNLLVKPDGRRYTIKVSDFGMTRSVESAIRQDSSKELCSIKWAAPEIFTTGKFTLDSDRWSFGVVMWEFFAYGREPYADKSNAECVREVSRGYRLANPAGCPPDIYVIMLHCWNDRPGDRPRFANLFAQLGKSFKQLRALYEKEEGCEYTSDEFTSDVSSEDEADQSKSVSNISNVSNKSNLSNISNMSPTSLRKAEQATRESLGVVANHAMLTSRHRRQRTPEPEGLSAAYGHTPSPRYEKTPVDEPNAGDPHYDALHVGKDPDQAYKLSPSSSLATSDAPPKDPDQAYKLSPSSSLATSDAPSKGLGNAYNLSPSSCGPSGSSMTPTDAYKLTASRSMPSDAQPRDDIYKLTPSNSTPAVFVSEHQYDKSPADEATEEHFGSARSLRSQPDPRTYDADSETDASTDEEDSSSHEQGTAETSEVAFSYDSD